MAAVSVWGISAVRAGPPGSRLSSPQVSSRGAAPGGSQPPSPRLRRPGVSLGASRGRRAAAGPAAACAASRCSAPGLGLGAAAAPSRPTPRPSPRRPLRPLRPVRAYGSAPSLRRRPAPGSRRFPGGERPGRGAWGCCAGSPALPRGRARRPPARPPPARLLVRRSRRRARTPGCADCAETRAGLSRAGVTSPVGAVVCSRRHVWCCVCRTVSPGPGRAAAGLPVKSSATSGRTCPTCQAPSQPGVPLAAPLSRPPSELRAWGWGPS